ncbi:MBL fold metallo-hydrolase [Piscinibacter sakaiensis]|uniref:MBL fold metallo-hydrolase n=1 Tax=Piscinibacter sakaiensis TaxID=1547922 RepID=UPI003AAD12FC
MPKPRPTGAGPGKLEVGFPLGKVRALVVTHVHIDHVGRVPHLLAAGFKGPIYCSEPSALLLPMVLEDAIEVGFNARQGLDCPLHRPPAPADRAAALQAIGRR